MLDKSLPYIDFFMKRKKGAEAPVYNLPDAYKFVLFKSGDEKSWAEIETSVLEFDSETEAVEYFKNNFLPSVTEPEKRILFIETNDGEKVATATAALCPCENKTPWIHWVSVKPKHQGIGLGKALISKVTHMLLELDGDCDFYLHTQTWSHRAVRIYKKFGFEIIKDQQICHSKTNNGDYEQAVSILNNL